MRLPYTVLMLLEDGDNDFIPYVQELHDNFTARGLAQAVRQNGLQAVIWGIGLLGEILTFALGRKRKDYIVLSTGFLNEL